MPTTVDPPSAELNRGTVCLLARIVDVDSQPMVARDVDSLHYSVYEIDPIDPDATRFVAGHEDVELDPADVLTDALEISDMWSVDAIGHNFAHAIDLGSDETFPKPGIDYQIRYDLQPVMGERVVLRFRLRSK